jgi:hypothetical protein
MAQHARGQLVSQTAVAVSQIFHVRVTGIGKRDSGGDRAENVERGAPGGR